VSGPLGLALVTALEGAAIVGGHSALGATLYGVGMPKDCTIKYEADLKADRLLVIAQGQAIQAAAQDIPRVQA